MKITSFDEFKELTRRGTFVPVVKEIVGPLRDRMHAAIEAASARRPEIVRDALPLSDMLHDQLEALGYGH